MDLLEVEPDIVFSGWDFSSVVKLAAGASLASSEWLGSVLESNVTNLGLHETKDNPRSWLLQLWACFCWSFLHSRFSQSPIFSAALPWPDTLEGSLLCHKLSSPPISNLALPFKKLKREKSTLTHLPPTRTWSLQICRWCWYLRKYEDVLQDSRITFFCGQD